MSTKVCAVCGEEKPLDAFARNSANRDGLNRSCRPCFADYQRQRRAREPEPAPPPLDLSWQADAACKGLDTDLFFPERGEATAAAKKVCAGCPVQPDCLEFALANGEKWGLWGGASERMRRSIRARRGGRRRAS